MLLAIVGGATFWTLTEFETSHVGRLESACAQTSPTARPCSTSAVAHRAMHPSQGPEARGTAEARWRTCVQHTVRHIQVARIFLLTRNSASAPGPRSSSSMQCMRGIGRNGEHLYPAFPYTSYQRMTARGCARSLRLHENTAAVSTPSQPHQLSFPFNVRRGLGLWKLLYLDGKPFTPDPGRSAELNRGAYLIEGPGHCAECHSPAQSHRRDR